MNRSIYRWNRLIQVRFSKSVDREIRLPSFEPSCDLMLAKTVSGMDWLTVMDRMLFISMGTTSSERAFSAGLVDS
jgi:hypothetical protein